MIDPETIRKMREEANDEWVRRVFVIFYKLSNFAHERELEISEDTLLIVAERIVATERTRG